LVLVSSTFAVHLDPPRNGWIRVTLRATSAPVEIFASYSPADSMNELVDALIDVSHETEARVTFNSEPERFALTMRPQADAVELTVTRHADHRESDGTQTMTVVVPSEELLWAFWRALRAMMGAITPQDYRLQFRHELPETALRRLGTRLAQR
jgi:hypothetical protein